MVIEKLEEKTIVKTGNLESLPGIESKVLNLHSWILFPFLKLC